MSTNKFNQTIEDKETLMGETEQKLFVLDTNILLHDPLALYFFQKHDIVVPITELEELDRIKDSKRDVTRDDRVAIRALENLFYDDTPEQIYEGISITQDNQILNSVLFLQHKKYIVQKS